MQLEYAAFAHDDRRRQSFRNVDRYSMQWVYGWPDYDADVSNLEWEIGTAQVLGLPVRRGPRDYYAGAAPVVGDGRFSRKRAPDRPPPWARGRRARVCDHPELGVDAPSAPAYIRERSRALPVCDYLRQARQTTLGESGVEKLAECNLQGIQ